ncbi:MAG: FtsX-like permease family protein [Syntrophobacteraceae bacterium]
MHPVTLFLRLWTWFCFRQLLAHRKRSIAVLLGIALGAAVFTSVRLVTSASMNSFSNSMDAISGRADRTVACPGGRVPEEVVATLLRHRAVHTASPVLMAYVRPAGEPSEPFLLIGFDPILDRPLRAWQAGRPQSGDGHRSAWVDLIARPFTLLASPRLAQKLRLAPGDIVQIEHIGRHAEFSVLSVLENEGLALADGGEIAVTDIATFQEFTGLFGQADRVDILLKSGASAKDLEEIRGLLPPGLVLERPSEPKESGLQLIRAYQLNLSVLSFVSLFVGMFLVYSLVSLHVTSRRHDLAVLRSIGASPRMLFSLYLAEGAFFGLLGWLCAIPLSAFITRQLLGHVSATITHLFVRVQVDRLVLEPWELAASFTVTLAVSILAALQPAWNAMKVPPREIMLMHEASASRIVPTRRLAALGAAAVVAVWPLSLLPGVGGVPVPGYTATFLLFTGFSLFSPWLLRLAGTIIPPLLRRTFGVPACLGGRFIRDAGPRVAVSVGALITAMALFVSLTIMIHSFRGTVETWVNQSLAGDIFLRPRLAEFNEYRDPLPREFVDVLEHLDTPVDLMPYHRIYLRHGTIRYQFEAIRLETFVKHARFLFLGASEAEILSRMMEGRGVVVSEVFSNQTGLKTGDRYRAAIEGLDVDLPILGVTRDYRTQGGVVHYSLTHFEKLAGRKTWSGARLFLAQGGPAPQAAAVRVRNEILARCSPCGSALEITVGRDLRQGVLKIFDETFAITTVLLLIALFVAALGIATTLTVLVLERSAQFHTLLATGASRGQVRTMLFWEALLMVCLGEAAGLCCGFVLSYLLIFVINRQSFGWTFLYGVDWGALAAAIPLILATALLAVLPAGRNVLSPPSAQALRER